MISAITYQDMMEDIKNNDLVEDTIGILFTRPDLETGKNILDSLNHYHHLTGCNINFYLPGYGAYWNSDIYPDMREVTIIDGAIWSFSDKAFVSFVSKLESVSSWKYSGESELLIIPYFDKKMNFSKVGRFHLDAMLNDGTISSISSFITNLSRVLQRDNSLNSIKVNGIVKNAKKNAVDEMMEKIPNYFSKFIKSSRHYLCHNYMRKNN